MLRRHNSLNRFCENGFDRRKFYMIYALRDKEMEGARRCQRREPAGRLIYSESLSLRKKNKGIETARGGQKELDATISGSLFKNSVRLGPPAAQGCRARQESTNLSHPLARRPGGDEVDFHSWCRIDSFDPIELRRTL